jgi:hypothetical protein
LLLECVDAGQRFAPSLVTVANAVSGATGLHEGDDRQNHDREYEESFHGRTRAKIEGA